MASDVLDTLKVFAAAYPSPAVNDAITEIETLRANEWPFGQRPNPVMGHTFGDFAVWGDEKSIKRVQAAMHEHDAMMPARIERIQSQEAEIKALRARVGELEGRPVAVASETFDALEALAQTFPVIRGYFARATGGADLDGVLRAIAAATLSEAAQ